MIYTLCTVHFFTAIYCPRGDFFSVEQGAILPVLSLTGEKKKGSAAVQFFFLSLFVLVVMRVVGDMCVAWYLNYFTCKAIPADTAVFVPHNWIALRSVGGQGGGEHQL